MKRGTIPGAASPRFEIDSQVTRLQLHGYRLEFTVRSVDGCEVIECGLQGLPPVVSETHQVKGTYYDRRFFNSAGTILRVANDAVRVLESGDRIQTARFESMTLELVA